MAEGAGLWSKIIGTAQIVLGVRWPLADSQETIPPLVPVVVVYGVTFIRNASAEPGTLQNMIRGKCLQGLL